MDTHEARLRSAIAAAARQAEAPAPAPYDRAQLVRLCLDGAVSAAARSRFAAAVSAHADGHGLGDADAVCAFADHLLAHLFLPCECGGCPQVPRAGSGR